MSLNLFVLFCMLFDYVPAGSLLIMMFGVCHIIIHGQTILFSNNNLFLSLLIKFWMSMLVDSLYQFSKIFRRFHVVDIT